MRMRVTDADFVERLLDELEGKSNRLKADAIVKKLGKRIRQRPRDREYIVTGDTAIVLRPLQLNRADQVRSQLVVEEQDVAAAVSWVRETR